MARWFDSLFARLLLVQIALALTVAALFGALTLRQQAQALARATAPLWAAAIMPMLQGAAPPPDRVTVRTTVALREGPPPPDATPLLLYPRYRALAAELRALGVPLRSWQVSGRTGDSVTWLELESEGRRRWIGIRGELEGTDVRERGSIGFAIAFVMILLCSWWLNRRVLQPVADLRRAMRRFEADGLLPPPAAASAPVELRELAQQFAHFAAQRRDLDLQRQAMLAAISHDLRSPLGRIRLAAELLPDAPGVAVRRDAIARNVQLADRLLGAFIDMARAEDEALTDAVDLAALLRAVAEADVEVAGIESVALLQPASAVALERALRNLIDNARLHGRGPITLSLTAQGRHAVLAVRDQGPGIPAGRRAAMLQPFQRGEQSRSVPGTGLGLAIVQRTAERHGGRLLLLDAAPGLRAELHLPLR